MLPCLFHIKNIIYIPVPGVNSLEPAASAWSHAAMSLSYKKYYLHTSVRCKQPRSESFLLIIGSPRCRVFDTIGLILIRFWRVGHGRVVRTAWHSSRGWRCFEMCGLGFGVSRPVHDALRSLIVYNLLPVIGDMLSCLPHINNNNYISHDEVRRQI